MDGFFFRVDHDLLRSESFQSLGGSAIKVYLTIGLYSDFGTGWAFPSIRTMARQAGLSRQTVLDAIEELMAAGLLARTKARGKSNAYRIIRQAPARPKARTSRRAPGGPDSCGEGPPAVPFSFEVEPLGVPDSCEAVARPSGRGGRGVRPERELPTREDTASIAIPETPFRMTAEGRLLVAVDLHELLTDQGLPRRTAERLVAQKDPEAVAKVLLNAFYLRSRGKLQNGPGYIRAGIEEGYDLLPQVANRLEAQRRALAARHRSLTELRDRRLEEQAADEEDAAIRMVLDRLGPSELQALVDQAVATLPGPLVRRNPTLSNPFVRMRVYELAGGEPSS
jgi:DNA-binding Lrp family transcriptional regulator